MKCEDVTNSFENQRKKTTVFLTTHPFKAFDLT